MSNYIDGKDKQRNVTSFKSIIAWFLTAFFFAYQFMMRVYPGIIREEMMVKFNIDASGFGFFAGSYYITYSLIQVPMAIFLSKYGFRIVAFLSATCIGLSHLLFMYTDNFYVAVLSRMITGMFSAAGFLSSAAVIQLYFKNQQVKMLGWTLTVGLGGAVFGGAPVVKLGNILGSHLLGLFLGCGALTLGVLMFIMLPGKTADGSEGGSTKDKPKETKLQILCAVLKNKPLLLLGAANLLMVGVLEGFADAWGVSFIKNFYQVDAESAASIPSLIFMGMMAAGPVLGIFIKNFRDYYMGSYIFGVIMFVSMMLVLFVPIGFTMAKILCFTLGFASSYTALLLSLVAFYVPEEHQTIGFGVSNGFNMIGGTVFHNIIGIIMTTLSTGERVNQVTIYSIATYQTALFCIPACIFIGLICIILAQRYQPLKNK